MANKLNKRRKQFARMKKKPHVPHVSSLNTTDFGLTVDDRDVEASEMQRTEERGGVGLDVGQKLDEALLFTNKSDHSAEWAATGRAVPDCSVELNADDRQPLMPNKVDSANSFGGVVVVGDKLQLAFNKMEANDSFAEAIGKLRLIDETMEVAPFTSNSSATDNPMTGSGYQGEDEHNCVSSGCMVVLTGNQQNYDGGHVIDACSRSEPQLALFNGFPHNCYTDNLSTTSSECDSTSTKLTTSSESDTNSSTTLDTSCMTTTPLSSCSSSSLSSTSSSLASSYYTSTGTKRTSSEEDSYSERSTTDESSDASSADTYYTSKSTSSA